MRISVPDLIFQLKLSTSVEQIIPLIVSRLVSRIVSKLGICPLILFTNNILHYWVSFTRKLKCVNINS